MQIFLENQARSDFEKTLKTSKKINTFENTELVDQFYDYCMDFDESMDARTEEIKKDYFEGISDPWRFGAKIEKKGRNKA